MSTMQDVGRFCDELRAKSTGWNGYDACNHCPIRPACHGEVFPLTQEKLDAKKVRCVDLLPRQVAA